MKRIYAVADVVPRWCDYLTAGKEYLAVPDAVYPEEMFQVVDDAGDVMGARWGGSTHLDGMPFRKVERDEPDIADELAEALKSVLSQLETVLPSSGRVHDERTAITNAVAVLNRYNQRGKV
jgi:hypothetical protein